MVAARASSVVGGRKWATIGLFNHALCFPQRLWALGSTREKSSSRLAALAQTLWGEAGRWIPRARSRRVADSCHVSAAETSMPGQGWIARMKSTTRHVAGERAVAHAPRQLAWSCAWAWRRGAPRRTCVMRGGRGQAGGGRALSSRAAGSALRRPSCARGLPRSGRGGEGTTVHAENRPTRQTDNVKKKIDSSTVPHSCSLSRALSSAT